MGTGIEVSTEASIGYITVGNELKGDFEDCAVTYAEGVGEYEAISKMKKASKKFDLPRRPMMPRGRSTLSPRPPRTTRSR